jgi:hypothetical protein
MGSPRLEDISQKVCPSFFAVEWVRLMNSAALAHFPSILFLVELGLHLGLYSGLVFRGP